MQCNVPFTTTNEKEKNTALTQSGFCFKEKTTPMSAIPHVCNWNIAINCHFFFKKKKRWTVEGTLCHKLTKQTKEMILFYFIKVHTSLEHSLVQYQASSTPSMTNLIVEIKSSRKHFLTSRSASPFPTTEPQNVWPWWDGRFKQTEHATWQHNTAQQILYSISETKTNEHCWNAIKANIVYCTTSGDYNL